MSIILASASPRRKELLEMLGISDLKIIPAVGEERAPEGLEPGALVELLSRNKAAEVAARAEADDVIVAADTVVVFDHEVFGKPKSREHAVKMLSALSGNTHRVFTGVTVMRRGQVLSRHNVSFVTFREMTAREIDAYIATGEPMDKAGAYGAQGKGALFVKKIDGDFFNVMGLPICLLGEMLTSLGVDIL